jgi:hypothetical protein
MGRLAQRQIFSPSCPSGGTWYACSTDSPSQFVGCCEGSGDPCKSSCSARNLKPASFDAQYYLYLPDVSCPSTSSPYKCLLETPFFGCCKSNACSTGCASSDLEAASLPSDSSLAASFSPSSTYSSSSPTSTSSNSTSSSSSTTSATTSPTTSTTPTPAAAPSSSRHTKLVAGASGGGAALFAIIVGWLLYHCLYARRSRKIKHEEFDRRLSAPLAADTTMSQVPKQDAAEPLARSRTWSSINFPVFALTKPSYSAHGKPFLRLYTPRKHLYPRLRSHSSSPSFTYIIKSSLRNASPTIIHIPHVIHVPRVQLLKKGRPILTSLTIFRRYNAR